MIDLGQLELYHENNRIEAKKALGGLPESIWETYSAFANTFGGLILLGVEEYRDKSLHTVNLPDPGKLIGEFWRLVNDPRKASVNLLSGDDVTVENVGGDHIVVIRVPVADRRQKPVYVEGNPSNAYHRNGEGDYRCTAEELAAMRRDAEETTEDMRVIGDAEMTAFREETVRAFRNAVRACRPGHALEDLDTETFLLKTGAAGIGEDGKVHPTAAGLLAFGQIDGILRVFPEFSLSFGPKRPEETAENLYQFFIRVSDALEQEVLKRSGTKESSDVGQALREALTNCLVHADYCGGGGVSVEVCESGIRLTNPGGFRIDPESAKRGGTSDPRNAVLKQLFALVDAVERPENGIPAIFRIWRQKGWKTPEIRRISSPERTVIDLSFRKAAGKDRDRKTADRAGDERLFAALIAALTDRAVLDKSAAAEALGISEERAAGLLDALTSAGVTLGEETDGRRFYRLKA